MSRFAFLSYEFMMFFNSTGLKVCYCLNEGDWSVLLFKASAVAIIAEVLFDSASSVGDLDLV